MKREVFRVKGDEFCSIRIEISADGRLSICGTAGYVVTEKQAEKEALERTADWLSEDDNLKEFNARNGTRYRSPMRAARYAHSFDGAYHGLDVVKDDGGKVFIGHSFGQIREELLQWFPECAPYLRWHLNDMHAECEHQEARGETYKTHPSAECPDCGWKLGHGWHKRTLPGDVIRWAETFGAE